MVWRIFGIGPVVLIWLDMLYGLLLNLSRSLSLDKTVTQANRLDMAPNVAFRWLQVLSDGGMIVVMSFAFLILLQLNRAVKTATPWPLNAERVMGLALVLAFSLPAWWHWFWALWDFLHGYMTINWQNLRYLVVTLLLPYPAWLCLRCLIVRQQQRSRPIENNLNANADNNP